MHAVRNISLCTKDCLCLYVCPTGATDTETGQIDSDRCISGCRLCVDACPSHAISLVPEVYPEQQEKESEVIKALGLISKSKSDQETISLNIEKSSDDPIIKQFAEALKISNRIMSEDILRESGFMLPQSSQILELISKLSTNDKSFPKDVAEKIIDNIKGKNKIEEGSNMKKYRCTVCGYEHEGDFPDGFKCPVCSQPSSAFELITNKENT